MKHSWIHKLNNKNRNLLFLSVVAVGVALRMLAASRGHNFDMESWRIVADIVNRNGNVYAETERYNYGPIWFYILHALDSIPIHANDFIGLRWKVAIFLTLVDFAIFIILLRNYTFLAGLLFFLNPVSIIISGFHNQFDNLAVLVGILSINMYKKSRTNKCACFPLTLLGVSLAVKHVFFMFPLWISFKCTGWKKMAVLVLPFVVFAALFVPFINSGYIGIVKNVFLYKSFDNAPFWSVVTPYLLYVSTPKILLFMIALFCLGLYCKDFDLDKIFWIYLISLVVFSSAIANQYLAICIPAVSIFWNNWYLAYTIAGTFFLLGNSDGLHFEIIQRFLGPSINGYMILVCILSIGLTKTLLPKNEYEFISSKVMFFPRWVVSKVKFQFKSF